MIEKIKNKYSKAIRTALLAYEKNTGKWYHLFSVIELQMDDEYPYNIPNEKWKEGCVRTSISKLREYCFYLSIDEIDSVDMAIRAFESPNENYVIGGNDISFANSSFIKEPSGKYPMVFASNLFAENGVASILPKRKSGLLVWSQIDNERKTDEKFLASSMTKEMQAIQELTTRWLGFDILQKREHLGNVYLSAPNPYFRDVKISLCLDPIGVSYKILTRKNSFETLKFRIIDKHGTAIAYDKISEVNNNEPVGFIELPHEPHSLELRIYNQEDDLVAIQEPTTFIRSTQIGLSVKQANLHVLVNDEKNPREFDVEKFSEDIVSAGDTQTRFNSECYFDKANIDKQYIRLAEQKEFIFYPGAKLPDEKEKLKEEARATIREIINGAKDTCYLCDPYFNSLDIVDFAFRSQNIGVKINILNSKENITKAEAKTISDLIDEYNKKRLGEIQVKVLRGDSILHDRFIIADTNVWFIGSSFNEFGNRATCIAKVPKSSDKRIIKEIEKWYYSDKFSQDIVEYVNDMNHE